VIQAPIDGVVLGRNVDVGQTVAASFQAPVLFVIANDLSRMQVNAAIGEADIGRVHVEQPVTFRVDAYPEETFAGTVEQVRLQPVTNQNVVTYNTIIAVENPGQKLMPGMTATVTIVSRNRPGVLRVPAAALRFRPEAASEPSARRSASTSAPGRPGLVFVPGPDGRPAARPVRLGISDGRRVEVLEGLEEGATVITGLLDGSQPSAPRPGASNNPFSPARPQPRTR
jgi:HlyD family secretion protein